MVRKRKEHRLLYKMIHSSDVVFEIVDSRFPELTRSGKVEAYANKHKKKLVIVMNKADLSTKSVVYQWKNVLSDEYETIFTSAQDRRGVSIIRKIIKREAKGREIRACMVGIPNTGKSSLINALKGKHSAPTSQRAGLTRGIHDIKITAKIMLVDSPGLAPANEMPEFELAVAGAVNPEEIVAPEVVAMRLLEKIHAAFPDSINQYTKGKILYENDSKKFLEEYSQYRFSKTKVKEISRIIIRDFQAGKIEYYHKPSN